MTLYADALVPVEPRISALHEADIASFARPVSWLSGEERLATVEAARAVRAAAGVQQPVPDTGTAPPDVLPEASLALIARLALAPRELTREDYTQARAGGLSDGEYVETVSLVAHALNVDVFARGVGAAPPALPQAEPGEPDYDEPAVVDEGAWLRTVPSGAAGGEDALRAYGGKDPQPFIYRALSPVPAEARRCIAGGNAQYIGLDKFMDFSYSPHPGLTRTQVELIAARISALNECFY